MLSKHGHDGIGTDTFSVQSSSKKPLKEFALAFHKFTMDNKAFEEFLERIESGD